MGKNRTAESYLDDIGSGYDPTGYDKPQEGKAVEEEVAPKNNWEGDKRNEIGAPAKSAMVMKKRRIARKLRRIAAELEALEKQSGEMDDDYKEEIQDMQNTVEEMQDMNDSDEGLEQETADEDEEAEDISEMSDEELQAKMDDDDEALKLQMGTSPEFYKVPDAAPEEKQDDEFVTVESSLKVSETFDHPIQYNPADQDSAADASSQMGDDQWIDIGPGSFDDKRTEIGTAAP